MFWKKSVGFSCTAESDAFSQLFWLFKATPFSSGQADWPVALFARSSFSFVLCVPHTLSDDIDFFLACTLY